MLTIKLSDNEFKILTKLRRATSDPRSEKALAVLLLNESQGVPAIAKQLKRHHHTIRAWVKSYKRHGIAGFERNFSPGRPSTRKIQIVPFIRDLLAQDPESRGYQRNSWTAEMLRGEYEKFFQQNTSIDSIKRALKDLGYSYKKAKATTPANSPTKIEKLDRISEVLSEINELISESEFDVYAVDESHFSTQPYIPRGWFKKRNQHVYSYAQKEGEFLSFRCITDKGFEILLEKRKIRQ